MCVGEVEGGEVLVDLASHHSASPSGFFVSHSNVSRPLRLFLTESIYVGGGAETHHWATERPVLSYWCVCVCVYICVYLMQACMGACFISSPPAFSSQIAVNPPTLPPTLSKSLQLKAKASMTDHGSRRRSWSWSLSVAARHRENC